jgi:hypothetical protein
MGNDVFLKEVRVLDDVGVGDSNREGTGVVEELVCWQALCYKFSLSNHASSYGLCIIHS